MNKKTLKIIIVIVAMLIVALIIMSSSTDKKTISTSGTTLSNTKIGWGIKRNDNHEQPDVGSKNRQIMDKYQGMYMGNNEKKIIYMTFDLGYEAGYTPKILEVLKQNDVKATFFITAHYLNTQPDLVKQMIDDGHIVGNHTPNSLMSRYEKTIKC